jgi:hypothetical protein
MYRYTSLYLIKLPSCEAHLNSLCLILSVLRLSHFLEHRRVALADYTGAMILDYFVAPTNPVVDFRTGSTGLTEAYLESR